MIILDVKKIACGYGSNFSLKEISLGLKAGEFLGIIGPNGSGKTTFLRAITKAIKPESGEIFLEGGNIKNLSFTELSKITAVVSQSPPLEFDLTVEEFVFLGRLAHRRKYQFFETERDEEIIRRALVLTDALKFKDRFLNELSGGERQMVFIARGLAQEPRLLLLDEPTSYLDIKHQVEILDLLKTLNKENGLTVIIILHDLNLASEYCDRLLLLNNGSVHKIGPPQEVLTYEIIEEVYKTVVVVEKNPVSGKPYVLPVSLREMKRKKEK